ncbi:MAG: hypothetical protein PHX38_12110 [Sulfuricella sp.]|nr:hypothetical protein [Sulfuricella sp.]
MRRPNRSGGTTNHPTQRSLRPPARRPEEALAAGIGDEDLRKMTAAILEQLKTPSVPPSMTILDALKQVRDRSLGVRE